MGGAAGGRRNPLGRGNTEVRAANGRDKREASIANTSASGGRGWGGGMGKSMRMVRDARTGGQQRSQFGRQNLI